MRFWFSNNLLNKSFEKVAYQINLLDYGLKEDTKFLKILNEKGWEAAKKWTWNKTKKSIQIVE